MPRIPRQNFNSCFFHVIVQGIEKKNIFTFNRYKEKYRKVLLENLKRCDIELLGYCIMDNHAHLLIYTESILNLSKFMQIVNTTYALYYNRKENRVGYLFRDRFRSIPILSDRQLYRTLVYIHFNPVSAKICNHPGLYPYSSYNEYLNRKGIATKEVLKIMNFDEEKFLEIFEFIHLCMVNGEEFEQKDKKKEEFDKIERYIEEKKIIDIIFQSDKVKKMIIDLKKENISFTRIAEYLQINNRKLKQIISE